MWTRTYLRHGSLEVISTRAILQVILPTPFVNVAICISVLSFATPLTLIPRTWSMISNNNRFEFHETFWLNLVSDFQVWAGDEGSDKGTLIDAFVRVIQNAISAPLILRVVPFICGPFLAKCIFAKTVAFAIVVGSLVCVAIRVPRNPCPNWLKVDNGPWPCKLLQCNEIDVKVQEAKRPIGLEVHQCMLKSLKYLIPWSSGVQLPLRDIG